MEINDMYDEKNTECALFGSEECKMLHQQTCLSCRAGKMKPEAQLELKTSLERMRREAPKELVEALAHSDTCRFCKADPKPAECYAKFDLAKELEGEEERGWTSFINKSATKKANADVLPIQAACCKKCRSCCNKGKRKDSVLGSGYFPYQPQKCR